MRSLVLRRPSFFVRLLFTVGWFSCDQAISQNLIKNGDFEQPLGPDNWTVEYTGVLDAAVLHPPTSCGPEDFMLQDRTTQAHKDRIFGVWDGNYFGGHFRPNSDWLMHAYFKQTVTNLIPGSNYIVTAWMSQNQLVEKVQVYLEVMGGTAGALSRRSPYIYTNVWGSYSVTNSASSNGQIEIRLHYNKNLTTANWKWRNMDAFYDHVSVVAATQAPPVIVTQPYAANVCIGDTVALTVAVASGAPVSYQWFYNTYTRVAGATNATLTIANAQSTNSGYYSVDVSNGYEVTSSNALLGVGTTITQQPSGTNICSGASATFSVAAYGVGTVLYQWQRNGVNLGDGGHYSGATTTMLTVSDADTNDAANYSCVVSSDCGSVTSSVVSLTFSGANITQQPSDAAVGLGCTASFAVAGTGCGLLTYQWQKNQTNLNNSGHYSGCTTATLTITGIDGNDQGSYRCAVTDGPVTTYSSNATLTIMNDCAPCGLQNGNFEGSNTGGVATGWTGYQRAPNPTTVWSVETASPPTGGGLQYQQILNTSSAGGAGVRQDIIGCTIGATYNISGWMRGNSTNATCRVKCSPGLSTDWSTAIDLDPPQTYTGSDWTTFSGTVVATGTTMTVWLDGQTGGSGQNDAECFDSVTVTCALPPPPPDITQQPIGTNICPGATATFTVAASGLGTLTYQWQKNQDDLSDGGHYSGTTTPTLTVANASAGDAADYRCVVNYDGSSTNSNEVTLMLKASTSITEQPADQTVNAGGTANFSVTATGADTLTYQWQTNGVNLSDSSHFAGCTEATLWATNVSSADAVNYRCLVSGGCGSVTSSLVMLAINTCDPGDLLGHGDMEDASNYSVCPDWESYAAGFNSDKASWAKEGTIIHGGLASQRCRIQTSGAGSLVGVRQTIDANVGDAFTFEGWVQPVSNPGAGQQVAMAVSWDGSTANPTTNGSTTWMISTGVRDVWTQLQNLSGNATAASVTLFLDSRRIASSQDLAAYWDDVVCYRAYVPPAPTVLVAGSTSLYVNVVPGCNWTNSSAQYAITIDGGYYTVGTHWVQADGSIGTAAVWQTDATWATTGVSGLTGATTYTLKVQARYSDTYPQATSLGAGTTITTDGPAPPTITQQPSTQNLCPGADATFGVTATGEGTVTYQWQTNGVDISDNIHYGGCTTATLTVTNTGSTDETDYRCIVSNEGGGTPSSQVALTLKAASVITGQPSATTVCLGSNATFTVTAIGDGTLTYQWQKNNADLSDGGHYSGTMTATLTITGADANDVANYGCVVSGGCGSITSSARALNLKAATAITQHPSSQILWVGSNAVFSVTATGDGVLAYQWRKNGGNLNDGGRYSGATTATLTIMGVDTDDAATYACAVTGGCGSVTSSNATLRILTGGVTSYLVNRPIPDGSLIGISDTRTISADMQSVSGLKVKLKISGTYNGDLFCYLAHSSGFSVLLNRVGRTASNLFGYDDPGLDVTFDDGATNDVHGYRQIVTGNDNAPLGTNVTGAWVTDGRTNRPSEVLDTDLRPAKLDCFTGLDPNGQWTLFVADVAGGDQHTLVSWGLEITGTEARTISGQVQLEGFTGTGARTAQFVASDSVGVPLQTNDVGLTFAGSPKLADYSLSVPTNTAYLSVKTAWNLRRRQAVTFTDWAATNNFTGSGGQLLGGDISGNNNLVNTADYTELKGNWLMSTESADITGDGLVNTADYTILKGNWLKAGDPE